MGNLQKIVYLSQAEYETLVTNGTITKDGVTITYSQDDLYITPEPEPNYCGWYTGTAITGTSETASIFSDSGITYAMVGDMYLNTSTNNTYRCTEEGDAANAKWVYVNNIQGDVGPAGSEYTVLVQSTEPTEESNKLWIPNGNNGVTQQVPTTEDIKVVHERMDVMHGMVGYGNGYEDLPAEPSSSSQYKRVGVRKNGTQITLTGTSGSSDLRIRISGQVARTSSNDSVDSWTSGISLTSGHKYKLKIRYISGTIVNASSNYPGSRIYKVGTHTSEGSVTVDGYSSERVYTADNDAVNIVLYVYANTTLTNAVYEILLEDLTIASVQDVQINGTSILQDGVANVPVATSAPGVVAVGNDLGIGITGSTNKLYINKAGSTYIKPGTDQYRVIVPYNQHESVFYGLAKAAGDTTQYSSNNAVGVYTEDAKSAIAQMLNAPESVSGSTPSITAAPGVRYICGECSELTITAPASGCIDVMFTSGSTPTVLTVTPTKTGVTAVKWANGFDPTSLDADTTYEINILDGEWGVACAWT